MMASVSQDTQEFQLVWENGWTVEYHTEIVLWSKPCVWFCILQLLMIFITGKLSDYQAFSTKNKDFINGLGM